LNVTQADQDKEIVGLGDELNKIHKKFNTKLDQEEATNIWEHF
jgi:hypothetical protein